MEFKMPPDLECLPNLRQSDANIFLSIRIFNLQQPLCRLSLMLFQWFMVHSHLANGSSSADIIIN